MYICQRTCFEFFFIFDRRETILKISGKVLERFESACRLDNKTYFVPLIKISTAKLLFLFKKLVLEIYLSAMTVSFCDG